MNTHVGEGLRFESFNFFVLEIVMNKKFVCHLVAACLLSIGLVGCDQSPNEKSATTNSGSKVVEVSRSIPEQAIDAAMSSPETAARLAKGSPEAVAIAAAKEAEITANKAAAAPESSLVKVAAYANLADIAAAAAPQSQAAKNAATQANQAKAKVESIVKSGKK